MSNKRKLKLFIATSLDGYIATEDESLEWLFNVEGEGDNGYSEFFGTVDTVLMGRKTYDWLLENTAGEYPYKNEECYVFTRSRIEDTENVKFINDPVVHFTKELQKQNGKDIWLVGGGELIHSFIKETLIDELIITVAPIILGNGIPLFKKSDIQTNLSLIRTRTFHQFVELHYQVNK
ncbi:dihydrofolate reductase family protein [Rummeliibacillus pycnus]|uniref:dihydrofolate reductase family protein n=1 Tax=Rummeliibacillus pycnus TaxID=101070 RepID=UPI000C9BBCE9|nr:dihydrofolate reductase family protein [Rummeliibacillus pycnus]